ncbi:MAG TPA: outer membrane beta-barrel protein [Chitinophagaceae bacterium]|nr:outer membrane beta-barrel protein [Chitinophagaceae bacterium]
MKKIFTLCLSLCLLVTAFSQTDTTGKQNSPQNDTIRIGGITIIRKAGTHDRRIVHDSDYKMRSRHSYTPSNVTTNWCIFDFGFSNYSDKTNYASLPAQAYAPGSNETWFELKDGKSRNFNFWFFMQRLNVIKHVVNLKYGVLLELNNYHYKRPIRYDDDPPAVPNAPIVSLDGTAGRSYKKNKLAADYLTVPMMVNFNFTPKREQGFGFSAGVSVGYLYSARHKTITSDEGKEKAKDDFGLEKWKLSYVGEISLGPVRFYGSYAFNSMYERGLDITPYNFGFRFSKW